MYSIDTKQSQVLTSYYRLHEIDRHHNDVVILIVYVLMFGLTNQILSRVLLRCVFKWSKYIKKIGLRNGFRPLGLY